MAEATTTASKRPSSWTGFFGDVLGTVAETAKEVLPNWTAQQLDLQRDDQLEQPTFIQQVSPPRVDTLDEAMPGPISAMGQTAFEIAGTKISYMMLALGFTGLLAFGLIMRAR